MSHERRPMDVYTCDGCGTRRIVDMKIDTPPVGWHGTITVVDGGGDSFEFYACKPDCRLKAIDNAYALMLKGPDGG